MYLVRYSRKILPKPQWIRPSKKSRYWYQYSKQWIMWGAVIVDSLQILLAVLFLIFLQNVFQNGKKTLPLWWRNSGKTPFGKTPASWVSSVMVMVDSGFSLIRVRRAFTIFSRVCWLGVFFEDFCFSMVKLLLKITL